MIITKLDEIVDEEFAYWRPSDPPRAYGRDCAIDGGKRIAERAFRHGVERGVHAAVRDHPGITMFDSVQPAPAGEGEARPGFHESYCDDRRRHTPGNGRCDRRKGERRKVVSDGALRLDGYCGKQKMYFDVKVYLWRDDRRSGLDRRKK